MTETTQRQRRWLTETTETEEMAGGHNRETEEMAGRDNRETEEMAGGDNTETEEMADGDNSARRLRQGKIKQKLKTCIKINPGRCTLPKNYAHFTQSTKHKTKSSHVNVGFKMLKLW